LRGARQLNRAPCDRRGHEAGAQVIGKSGQGNRLRQQSDIQDGLGTDGPFGVDNDGIGGAVEARSIEQISGPLGVNPRCPGRELVTVDTVPAAGVFRHGWFYTGDIRRLGEEHYLYILGREKDMVISGGYNIYAEGPLAG